jgi:hypothetical protein
MVNQQRYETQRLELDADKLIDEAQQVSGLTDFGPFEFDPALRKLLDCFAKDMPLSEQGIYLLKSDIVRLLVNRLRMQKDIKAHPEILDEDVSDPCIIIGLPRSGTTKLHKMLSAPVNVQKTLFWKIMNPAPFPDARSGEIDPRITAMTDSDLLTEDNPDMDAAHRIALEEVEEEGLVYQLSFKDYTWSCLLDSPEYFDWIMAESSAENYRLAKTVFQYLQWQDGGKRNRPWVFKSVPHLAYVDRLLESFPNATLIHPHRDPHKCIPSFAKFTTELSGIYAESVDKHDHGAETLRTWTVALQRYLVVRKRLNLESRVLDVDYEMVRHDPMPIVREAYARSPFELSEEADQKMLAWHNHNVQGKHGKHEYSLQEFGLHDTDIQQNFGEYMTKFIKSN